MNRYTYCLTVIISLLVSKLLAAEPEAIPPGTYTLVIASNARTDEHSKEERFPVMSGQRITVTKDASGRLMVASDDSIKSSGELHQHGKTVIFTLTEIEHTQQALEATTFICHHIGGSTITGVFSTFGQASEEVDGLYNWKGSFFLLPASPK